MTEEEWEEKQSEEENDERNEFRVLPLIMEAKRPNDTAFETLLTREALHAQIEFEEFLYSIKLPSDYLKRTPNNLNTTNSKMLGLQDLCEQYNLTTEEMDEDLEEDCNKNKEFGCPVKLRPKCFST